MKITKTAVKNTKKASKKAVELPVINRLATQSQKMVACSNYVKNGKLSEADVQKFVPAAIAIIKSSDVEMKKLIAKMYSKVKDWQGKPYKRMERVFASLVGESLELSTSTVHEKLTECVNLGNRPLIHQIFGKMFNDKQLDSIRGLVYKFQI